jgi:hypothetical protein
VDECPNSIHVQKHRLCKRCYDYLRDELYAGPKVCALQDCGKPHRAQGFCNKHYHRFWRYGDPRAYEDSRYAPKRGPYFGRPDRKYTNEGYVKVRATDGENRIYWVLEHRLVMEGLLGRRLQAGETVHHKNGVRDDNSPGNLELWSSSHCPGQRVEDLVKWAKEILNLYGDTVFNGKLYTNA